MRILGILVFTFVVAGMVSGQALSADRLVIHAAEWGVGKFHRFDNQVHPYPESSVWRPYILPSKVEMGPAVRFPNPDGSFTIFFSTLDELIDSTVEISKAQGKPVSVFNLLAHGLPGSMWYPPNAKFLNSIECYSWKAAAAGADQKSYNQYYSPITEEDVMQIRSYAENPGPVGCTTGLPEWRRAIQAKPQFLSVLADDVQIHFLSCVVGLGKAGQAFTQGMAELLLTNKNGQLQTSVNFGLGDWSMNEGMGFWDFVSSEQIKHDNLVYSKNKTDREVMQLGTLRVARREAQGWQTGLIANKQFMLIGFDPISRDEEFVFEPQWLGTSERVDSIRIPGTAVRATVNSAGE